MRTLFTLAIFTLAILSLARADEYGATALGVIQNMDLKKINEEQEKQIVEEAKQAKQNAAFENHSQNLLPNRLPSMAEQNSVHTPSTK